jgi:heme-degrading monooxygenase HmoA
VILKTKNVISLAFLILSANAWGQEGSKFKYRLELTPHQFFSSSGNILDYDPSLTQVVSRVYWSPAAEFNIIREKNNWTYTAGLGFYRIKRELWMDWKNNDARFMHAEVDEIHSFVQAGITAQVGVSRRFGAWEIGLRTAVARQVLSRNMRFDREKLFRQIIPYDDGTTRYLDEYAFKKEVANTNRYRGNLGLSVFYNATENFAVGFVTTAWRDLDFFSNEKNLPELRMAIDYKRFEGGSDLIEDKRIMDIIADDPIFQLGIVLRYTWSKFKIPRNAGQNGE